MPTIDQGLSLTLEVQGNPKSLDKFFDHVDKGFKTMVDSWKFSWKTMGEVAKETLGDVSGAVKGVTKEIKGDIRSIRNVGKNSFKSLKNNASNNMSKMHSESKTITNKIGKSFDELASRGTKATDRLERNARRSLKGIGESSTITKASLNEMFYVIDQLGSGVSKIGETLTGMVGGAVAEFAPFEATLDELQVISKATDEQMGNLSDKFMDVGVNSKFTTQAMAEFGVAMSRGGVPLQSINNELQNFDDFANANRISLEKAGTTIVSSLRSMGEGFDQAQKFMDTFTTVANNSNTNALALGRSIKEVGGIATRLGVPLQSLTKELGILANRSLVGTQGAVQLRNILTRLVDPSMEASMWLDKLNFNLQEQIKIAGGDLRKVFTVLNEKLSNLSQEQRVVAEATIAGSRNMKGLAAVTSATSQEIEQLDKALADLTGSTKEQADAMKDNLDFALKSLEGSVSNLKNSFGKELAPIIRFVAENSQFLVDNLNSLPAPIKSIIGVVGLLGAGLFTLAGSIIEVGASFGILLLSMTSVLSVFEISLPAAIALSTSSLGALATTAMAVGGSVIASIAALAWPITALVATIAGAVAAYKYNFLGFQDLVLDVFKGIKDAGDVWIEWLYGLRDAVGFALNWIGDRFGDLKYRLSQFFDSVEELFNMLPVSVQKSAKELYNNINNFFIQPTINGIKKVMGWFDKLRDKSADAKIEAEGQIVDAKLESTIGASNRKLSNYNKKLREKNALLKKNGKQEEVNHNQFLSNKVRESKSIEDLSKIEKQAREIKNKARSQEERESAQAVIDEIKAKRDSFKVGSELEESRRKDLKKTRALEKRHNKERTQEHMKFLDQLKQQRETKTQQRKMEFSKTGQVQGLDFSKANADVNSLGDSIAQTARQWVNSGEAMKRASADVIKVTHKGVTAGLFKLGVACADTATTILKLNKSTIDLRKEVSNPLSVPTMIRELMQKGLIKKIALASAKAGDIMVARRSSHARGHVGIATSKNTVIHATGKFAKRGQRHGIGETSMRDGKFAFNPSEAFRLTEKAMAKGASRNKALMLIEQMGIQESIKKIQEKIAVEKKAGKDTKELEKELYNLKKKLGDQAVKDEEQRLKELEQLRKQTKEQIETLENSSDQDIASMKGDLLAFTLDAMDKEKEANAKKLEDKALAEKLHNSKIKKMAIASLKDRLGLLDQLQDEIAGINKTTEEKQLKQTRKMIEKLEKEVLLFNKRIISKQEQIKSKKKPDSESKSSSESKAVTGLDVGVNEDGVKKLQEQEKAVKKVVTAYDKAKQEQQESIRLAEKAKAQEELKEQILSGQIDTHEMITEAIKNSNKEQQTGQFFAEQTVKADQALLILLKKKEERLKFAIKTNKILRDLNKDMVVLQSKFNSIDDLEEQKELNRLQIAKLRAEAKSEEIKIQREINQALFAKAIKENKSIEDMDKIIARAEKVVGLAREKNKLDKISFEGELAKLGDQFVKQEIDSLEFVRERLKLTQEEIDRRKDLEIPMQTVENQERITELSRQRQGLASAIAISEGEVNKELFESFGLSEEIAGSMSFSVNRVGEMISNVSGLSDEFGKVLNVVMDLGKGVARALSGDVIGGFVQIVATSVEALSEALVSLDKYASGEMFAEKDRIKASLEGDFLAIGKAIKQSEMDVLKLQDKITEEQELRINLNLEIDQLDNQIDVAKAEARKQFLEGFEDETALFQPKLKMSKDMIDDLFSQIEQGQEVELQGGGTEIQLKRANKVAKSLFKLFQVRKNKEEAIEEKVSKARSERIKREAEERKRADEEAQQRREKARARVDEEAARQLSQLGELVDEQENLRIEMIENAEEREIESVTLTLDRKMESIDKEFDAFSDSEGRKNLIVASQHIARQRAMKEIAEIRKRYAKERKQDIMDEVNQNKSALEEEMQLREDMLSNQLDIDKRQYEANIERLEARLEPLRKERDALQRELDDLDKRRRDALANVDQSSLNKFSQMLDSFTIPEELIRDSLNRFGFNVDADNIATSTAELETQKEALEEFFRTRKQELEAQRDIGTGLGGISQEEFDKELQKLILTRAKFYDKIRKDDSQSYKTQLDGLVKFRDAYVDFQEQEKEALNEKFDNEQERIEESLRQNDERTEQILTDIDRNKEAIADLERNYNQKISQIDAQRSKLNKFHTDWISGIKGVNTNFNSGMVSMKSNLKAFIMDLGKAKEKLDAFNMAGGGFSGSGSLGSATGAGSGMTVKNQMSGSGKYMTHSVYDSSGKLLAVYGSFTDRKEAFGDPIGKQMDSGQTRWFDENEGSSTRDIFNQLEFLPGFFRGGIKRDNGLAMMRDDELVLPPDLSRFFQRVAKSAANDFNLPQFKNGGSAKISIAAEVGDMIFNNPKFDSPESMQEFKAMIMDDFLEELSDKLASKIGRQFTTEF